MHAALLAIALLAAAPLTRARELMHTKVTVALADPMSPEQADAAFSETFDTFAEVDAVMNEWRPDSALSRINAAAGKQPVEAPPRLCDVIRLSLDGARRTRGLFDPTWAALRDVWRFGDDAPAKVPARELVESRCPLIGWKDVEVRPLDGGAGCTVRLAREGMQLGLGGVAKGWGVDQAVARLRARGLKNFFVQAGGDLYLAGRNGERPWRAGIRDPRGPAEKSFARLEVSDAAFSTSGDYERFFVVDGVRYHHVIDPRTCMPARASRSATVLAKTATDAEFLTKATFILGGQEGLDLAESFGASAVLVDGQNRVFVSKGLEKKLERWPPTDAP